MPEKNVPPLVIRPLVLLAKEVELLLELAVNHTAKERQVTPEEVRQAGAYKVLGEYLSERVRVVSCKSLFLPGSMRSDEAASLRVVLPQIDYRRLEQNNVRTVDYSITSCSGSIAASAVREDFDVCAFAWTRRTLSMSSTRRGAGLWKMCAFTARKWSQKCK